MDIASYLQKSPRGTAAAVARAVGVHPVMVAQWAKGVKEVPVERCTAIERATGGAVRRQDLRPDWREHWPELVRKPRATKSLTAWAPHATQPPSA